MTNVRRSNIIAISVVISVLTIISATCLVTAVSIPSPSNSAPAILAWISGIALGFYLSALAMLVRDK
jgi:hypothetical protein